MEVDRAKGRGSLTRSVKLAQRVRYDNRPVGHYLTSDLRSFEVPGGNRTGPSLLMLGPSLLATASREMRQQPRSTRFSAAIFTCEIAVYPLVFLLFITSFSLPGNVATQLPSFVSRITEVRNLSVPSGL